MHLYMDGVGRSMSPHQLFTQIAARRMHRIEAEAELAELGAASKTNTAWPFLTRLHRIGQRATQARLEGNLTLLGRRATMALDPYLQ